MSCSLPRRFIVCTVACISSAVAPCHAALVSYLIDGIPSNVASVAPDSGSVALHLSASSVTHGFTNTSGNVAFSGSTDAFFARADFVAADLTTAVSNNNYIQFSVTVEDGFALNLSSIAFKMGATTGSASYTSTMFLRTSLDGYAANTVDPFTHTFTTNIGTPAFFDKSADLSGAPLQSLTGTILFRLYMTDNAATTAFHTRLDNLVLNGSVISAIPEPSSFALVSGLAGLACVIGARSRRRRG